MKLSSKICSYSQWQISLMRPIAYVVSPYDRWSVFTNASGSCWFGRDTHTIISSRGKLYMTKARWSRIAHRYIFSRNLKQIRIMGYKFTYDFMGLSAFGKKMMDSMGAYIHIVGHRMIRPGKIK